MAETETKKAYRVAVGHTVKHGTRGDDGERSSKTFKAGEELELTEAEAKRLGPAVESGDRRKGRDGQTTRLQRRIDEQQAEIDRLRGLLDAPKQEDDPGREDAIQSLRDRGDNFEARGEPDPQRVAAHAIDAIETARDLDAVSKEEVGMGGLARSRAPESEPAGLGPKGSDSKPSTGAGGNVQTGGKK
jgi:hypothetical protein